MIGVYKITNLINGKSYIGQSVHIERRWKEHQQPNAMSTIGLAIKKYGVNNFSFEVLEELPIGLLDEKEQYYIEKYNTVVPNGYNVMEKGEVQHTTFVTINKQQYYQIVEDIKNLSLTFEEIASKYNLSQRTITRINNGYTHKLDNIQYPIRKTRYENEKGVCLDCGKTISKGASRCWECASKAQRTVDRPSREELKKMIRNTPFTKIGKLYNVSDNTIRKWCESYSLPRKATEIKKYSNEDWELI